MSSFPSSLKSPLILLALAVLSISPADSTSRNLLANHMKPAGIQVTLRHVDAGGNFTKLELLQRAMKRGRKRVEKFHATSLAVSDSTVESQVHYVNGEYLMELAIGTPPASFQAIVDTGSDLIWTQCKPCNHCFDQPSPIFDPKKSSSFSKLPCSSNLCSAVQSTSCSRGSCWYSYPYEDNSSTQGFMAKETFTFDEVSLPNIGFGCSVDNEKFGFNKEGGLVGMSRGPLSLVSQLDEPKFSYCLTSIMDSNQTSTLSMGSLAITRNHSVATTPIISNPPFPSYYYITLEGITVGETQLPINKSSFALNEDGTGGMIIDSGTMLTYLEESRFDILKKEFTKQMELPVDDSNDTLLDLCFKLPTGANNIINVPKLIFHFKGADLELPMENYLYMDKSSGVACLAMKSSIGWSIFGNFQQQNMLVVHDLVKETISFVPQQCDQL